MGIESLRAQKQEKHGIWGGSPKYLEFIYKKLCIYSYMFNLQSSSKHSPFDAIHLWRPFFHCSTWVLNLSILMPFSVSAFVCLFFISPLPYHKMFPFENFFHPAKQKNSHSGWDQVNREGGTWGSCHFWSKTAEHSVCCGQVRYEIGKCIESLQKNNSLELNAASPNTSWYTDTDGFLGHSPSGGSRYYKGPPSRR